MAVNSPKHKSDMLQLFFVFFFVLFLSRVPHNYHWTKFPPQHINANPFGSSQASSPALEQIKRATLDKKTKATPRRL